MEEEKITFIKWLYDYSNVILSILSGFVGAVTGHLLTKSLSREERKWRINDPIIGPRIVIHTAWLAFLFFVDKAKYIVLKGTQK